MADTKSKDAAVSYPAIASTRCGAQESRAVWQGCGHGFWFGGGRLRISVEEFRAIIGVDAPGRHGPLNVDEDGSRSTASRRRPKSARPNPVRWRFGL